MVKIKIEDLLTKCHECGGMGRINVPPIAAPRAGGVGRPATQSPCTACHEVGWIPTYVGQVLIEFICRTKKLTSAPPRRGEEVSHFGRAM
jgi:hypothetical protein